METILLDTEVAAALLSLTAMEIVLGIDNIIFISVLASRLPVEQQDKARLIGLVLAMLTRVLLLFSLSWVMGLKAPLLQVASYAVSGRDLLLVGGGAFLVAKATREIHDRIEGLDEEGAKVKRGDFIGTLVQIILLDFIFSLDSVITAVGMVDELWIMVVAVIVSVIIMMVYSGVVSRFVLNHPTVKMLALSFLLLIGVVLVADGCGHHIPKGYIYVAMAFSVFVEMLNLAAARRRERRLQSGGPQG